MASIHCCNGCVAPKRHLGCHGTCPDYIEEKAEHEKRKAVVYKKKVVEYGLTKSKVEKIIKARRHRRKEW